MEKIFLEGTIELIVSLILSYILVFHLGHTLKSARKRWYIGSGIVSFVSIGISVLVFTQVIEVNFTVWWVRMIRGIVSGYLPASLFMFVMFAGAFPKDHPHRKSLMRVRTELSIIAVILYLPHTILYTAFSAPYGIKALLSGEIRIAHQLMTWTGLINSVLLVILGVTSIESVKKKMGLVKWKKLQKWSYLFYFNCFVHYMTLCTRGGHYERTVIYLIIYGTYLVMKIKYEATRKTQLISNRQVA